MVGCLTKFLSLQLKICLLQQQTQISMISTLLLFDTFHHREFIKIQTNGNYNSTAAIKLCDRKAISGFNSNPRKFYIKYGIPILHPVENFFTHLFAEFKIW